MPQEYEANNAIKIAVLQEQILGLRAQQKAHNETTQDRFNSLETKIDDLVAIMNRGRGAYAASMALAAGVGAVIIQLVSMFSTFFHK